jgi:hypothetical protein
MEQKEVPQKFLLFYNTKIFSFSVLYEFLFVSPATITGSYSAKKKKMSTTVSLLCIYLRVSRDVFGLEGPFERHNIPECIKIIETLQNVSQLASDDNRNFNRSVCYVLIWISLLHDVVNRVRNRTEQFRCVFGSTDGNGV